MKIYGAGSLEDIKKSVDLGGLRYTDEPSRLRSILQRRANIGGDNTSNMRNHGFADIYSDTG